MEKTKKIIINIVIVALLAILFCFAPLINPQIKLALARDFNIVTNKNALIVHFISVGEGDAAAINLPNGEVILIDAGVNYSASTLTNYVNNYVLNNDRDKDIDYLILSHADSDHTGGAINLLQSFNVEKIVMPTMDVTTAGYTQLKDYISTKNYPIIEPEIDKIYSVAGCNIEFLNAGEYSTSNDNSHVVKLSYLNASFLFTGDISSNVEADLVNKYGQKLDVDVLKVAHHGSDTSTSKIFLQATTPDWAVISCGENNSYGFPTLTVLENLNEQNVNVCRTDLESHTAFVVSNNYNFLVLQGNYTITNLSLDYRYLIIVIQGVVIINLTIEIVKQKKRKPKI